MDKNNPLSQTDALDKKNVPAYAARTQQSKGKLDFKYPRQDGDELIRRTGEDAQKVKYACSGRVKKIIRRQDTTAALDLVEFAAILARHPTLSSYVRTTAPETWSRRDIRQGLAAYDRTQQNVVNKLTPEEYSTMTKQVDFNEDTLLKNVIHSSMREHLTAEAYDVAFFGQPDRDPVEAFEILTRLTRGDEDTRAAVLLKNITSAKWLLKSGYAPTLWFRDIADARRDLLEIRPNSEIVQPRFILNLVLGNQGLGSWKHPDIVLLRNSLLQEVSGLTRAGIPDVLPPYFLVCLDTKYPTTDFIAETEDGESFNITMAYYTAMTEYVRVVCRDNTDVARVLADAAKAAKTKRSLDRSNPPAHLAGIKDGNPQGAGSPAAGNATPAGGAAPAGKKRDPPRCFSCGGLHPMKSCTSGNATTWREFVTKNWETMAGIVLEHNFCKIADAAPTGTVEILDALVKTKFGYYRKPEVQSHFAKAWAAARPSVVADLGTGAAAANAAVVLGDSESDSDTAAVRSSYAALCGTWSDSDSSDDESD